MSTFLDDGVAQLGVALERSHGVASLYNGTLDVVQHRRGAPFEGSGSTVVIDDTDRLFTQTWLSVGNSSTANTLRHSNKLRLNHPFDVMFAAGPSTTADSPLLVDPIKNAQSVPASVHLQTVRATSSSADEVLLNLMHVFGSAEQPAAATKPMSLDLGSLLKPFRPALTSFNETTINGMIPKDALERLPWKTTKPAAQHKPVAAAAAAHMLTIAAFEIRTFLATEF